MDNYQKRILKIKLEKEKEQLGDPEFFNRERIVEKLNTLASWQERLECYLSILDLCHDEDYLLDSEIFIENLEFQVFREDLIHQFKELSYERHKKGFPPKPEKINWCKEESKLHTIINLSRICYALKQEPLNDLDYPVIIQKLRKYIDTPYSEKQILDSIHKIVDKERDPDMNLYIEDIFFQISTLLKP